MAKKRKTVAKKKFQAKKSTLAKKNKSTSDHEPEEVVEQKDKAPDEESQADPLSGFLPVSFNEIEEGEAQDIIESEKPRKDPVVRRMLPYVFLFIVFVFGLFIFFPLNDTVREGLLYLQSNGLPLNMKKIDIGYLGGFDIEKVNFLSANSEIETTASSAEGKLSVLSIIGGDLELKAKLDQVAINHKSYGKVTNGVLLVNADIRSIMKNPASFVGSADIQGKDFIVQAKDIPFVGELRLLIKEIKLNADINKGRAAFSQGKNQIDTDIARIVFTGTAGVLPHGPLALNVRILLKQEFKDKKPGIYEMLNQMKILVSDSIEINIGGTTSDPKAVLKNAPAIPGLGGQ